MLEGDIIEVSHSPWRAQAFVVNGKKPRMVIDYSATINKFIEVDAYPFPKTDEMLSAAAEDTVFSTIDLKLAYHQVPLSPADRPYTAFEVNGKLYQFKRLPFGITNAVPVFQRIMDTVIGNFKLKKTRAFPDDVLISGKDRKEHDENVSAFLKAAKQVRMTLSCEKCKFGLTSINILWHVIGNGDIKPDPERLETLMNYPIPSSPAEIRRLLGFFEYNAKWVPQYSDRVKPHLDAFEQRSFIFHFECMCLASYF